VSNVQKRREKKAQERRNAATTLGSGSVAFDEKAERARAMRQTSRPGSVETTKARALRLGQGHRGWVKGVQRRLNAQVRRYRNEVFYPTDKLREMVTKGGLKKLHEAAILQVLKERQDAAGVDAGRSGGESRTAGDPAGSSESGPTGDPSDVGTTGA
jgi:hypothetical protein